MDLPGPRDREVEPSAHAQAAPIPGERQPPTDRLGRIVLPQHAHARRSAPGEAFGKGARHDEVLAEIGNAEQARIALEAAVLGDAGERRRQELGLAGGGGEPPLFIVMPGLDPAIHAAKGGALAIWIAGTSPATTTRGKRAHRPLSRVGRPPPRPLSSFSSVRRKVRKTFPLGRSRGGAGGRAGAG